MKYKKLTAVLLVVIFLVFSLTGLTMAKETLVRDSWAVMEQDEKPVGFGYDQFRQTDTGYLYVTDITMQISLLGSPSKITEHMELTVDKQYLARNSSLTIDVNGSKTIMKTEFNKDQIKMLTITSDGKETSSFFKVGKPVYFQISFLDSLIAAKKIKPGKEYGALIWDQATLSPLDCKLKINAQKTYPYGAKTIPVFEIQTTAGANSSTSLIDAKGDTYWEEDPGQKLIFHKVEKNEIPELQSLSMDVLLVPGNITVPQPFKSESSKLKVTWKDLSLADFKLEDNRQKLVKHVANEAGHEVTLTIQRERRDFSGKVTLPVSDPQFSSYLAGSPYITPELPEIQKIKEEVLADASDGWVATQKILSWVFHYIQPAVIPQTLSTEEILAQKRGKCVEYAVLFAAIARSAGLPTRLALGERYQDGAWVGHMWNEVWLGEWIAVDASHNQVAPDALLLKLVDSDTVMGTQKVRTGLIGQLGIIIDDIKVPQEALPSGTVLKTGIQNNVYTNAEFQCQIQAPAGWTITETKEQGVPLLVMQNPAAPLTNAILVLSSVPPGTTADQLLQSRIQLTQTAVEGFTLIRQEQAPLGGSPSPIEEDALGSESSGEIISGANLASVGAWSFSYQGSKTCQENWLLIQNDFIYLLVFTSPLEQWESYQTVFQEIRAKFQIL